MGTKVSQRLTGTKWQDSLWNRTNGEKQMTTTESIGASSANLDAKSWNKLPWLKINKLVLRLQMRIAKATL